MKKKCLLAFAFAMIFATQTKAKENGLMFTPQIDVSYALIDFANTNGFGLGLGTKIGYILNNDHRISGTIAYDYYWGKKGAAQRRQISRFGAGTDAATLFFSYYTYQKRRLVFGAKWWL